jgi:ribose/xylose/arabinose/galactoside ABC-type transport system permease subunit
MSGSDTSPEGAPETAAAPEKASTRAGWRRGVLAVPWLGPLAALVFVYVLFALLVPDTFARSANLVTMARQTVVVGIAAIGMTMVIVSGGIDLSVGSSVALATVVIARALNGGAGPFLAVLLGIAVSTAAGLLVGAAVAFGRIAPFVVSLGAMTILRGAAKGVAHEQKIDADARGLDSLLGVLPDDQSFMVFPPGVWIFVGLSAVFVAVLRYARFGRHVFAIGSNERTARLCGVRVEAVKLRVYALSGSLAGLAGAMEFATLTVGDPTDSIGLELEVIAAAVIGGASLLGGEGSIVGSVVGASLMTVIKTGSTHLGLPNWVEEVVTGVIIVAAVAVDRLRHRRL